MADDFEGRNVKLVYFEQTALGTAPVSPNPGYVLPFASFDASKSAGFTDYEEISGTSTPTKPMGTKIQIGGNMDHPLHFDASYWALRMGLGIPVYSADTPQALSSTFVFNLGSAAGQIAGFGIEKQQTDAASTKYRLFHGGRVTNFDFASNLESAVSFGIGMEFLDVEAYSATPIDAAPTEYTSEPVDSLIQVLNIAAAPVCYVESFSGSLDWRLQTDRYPVGCGGVRASLPRGIPMLSGSLGVFANDATMPLIAAAEAGTEQTFSVVTSEAALTAQLTWTISNAIIKMTGEPVDTTQGLLYTFDWKAYGDCLTATLINLLVPV